MAIDTPPIYSNIIYNSLFFPDANSTGFTQIQANSLYLRKTVQDIDPFLATFQSGIKTNTVDTISATGASNCGLFQGATNAVIDLGPTTQPFGHSALIRLGLANSTIQCGSGTGSLVIQTLTGFSATTNSLYNDLPNPINLGLTSSAIQIGTSQVATNTIGIGSASTALSSLGTNTLGPLKVNTINPTTTSGTIQIGQIATNTNVEIAAQASRSTTLHLGDGDTSSGAVHINNGLSASGNVQILNANYTGTQVKGSVNICTGTASSLTTGGAVNIHTGTTASNCTIGNINSKLNVDCAMDVLTLADSTPSINMLSGSVGAGVAGGSVSILSGSHNATSTGSNFNLMNSNCKGTATIGNALSTLTMNSGTINVNRPLTIGYSPPADSLAGLSLLGGIFTNTSGFVYTIGTTLTAFAPLNNLPAGRYLFQVYVFIPPFLPNTNIEALLVYSSSPISNNQTTGFTIIFGGNETYTATQIGSVSVNPFFQYDVVSPNVNIAVACKSGTGLAGSSVFTVKAIRIG